MRKMTSLLLAAGMTMALLSGCGGGTEAKETTYCQFCGFKIVRLSG